MSKHFGAKIIGAVLEMKAKGMTHRTIAEKFGLTAIQVKELVKRHNRKKRKLVAAHERQSRLKSRPLTSEHEYLKRIRQLEMEVELYRSFLQAVGRM